MQSGLVDSVLLRSFKGAVTSALDLREIGNAMHSAGKSREQAEAIGADRFVGVVDHHAVEKGIDRCAERRKRGARKTPSKGSERTKACAAIDSDQKMIEIAKPIRVPIASKIRPNSDWPKA